MTMHKPNARAAVEALDHSRIWSVSGRRHPQVRHAQQTLLMLVALTMMLVVASTIAYPRAAHSQAAAAIIKVDVSVVAKGHRASKLIGSGVVNDKNEKIGSLDDIIIDQKNVLFGIVQVGGFLGIGSRLVAVSFDSFKIDDANSRIELPGATKDELKNLAEFKYRT
jgi:hypothetical protein